MRQPQSDQGIAALNNYPNQNFLGATIFDNPLINGPNWSSVVLSSARITKTLKMTAVSNIFFAASAMKMLDDLFEPEVINLHSLHRKSDAIAISNIVAWIATSFVCSRVIQQVIGQMRTTRAENSFIIQITFFGCLNLFL